MGDAGGGSRDADAQNVHVVDRSLRYGAWASCQAGAGCASRATGLQASGRVGGVQGTPRRGRDQLFIRRINISLLFFSPILHFFTFFTFYFRDTDTRSRSAFYLTDKILFALFLPDLTFSPYYYYYYLFLKVEEEEEKEI